MYLVELPERKCMNMNKIFNISGDCKSQLHYMVDISEKLYQIKSMVDAGKYFTINRARQYGKTTTLKALERLLNKEYQVIRLDFQRLGQADFATEQTFVEAFSEELLETAQHLPDEIRVTLDTFAYDGSNKWRLRNLFRVLSKWCCIADKKIVLMIDEVDSASNNQIFLDFLAQLRSYYIDRDITPAFHSVILAGVYDIKNIRRKIRSEDEHKMNSPWNIAADFDVVMSFSESEIAGMLVEYEKDNLTGMAVHEIGKMLYDYTSGYPYLVSRLCKLMDENLAGSLSFPDKASAWTPQGLSEAVRILLSERNTLFESLENKLTDYPQLQQTLYSLLFGGETVVYNVFDESVNIAIMFGFVQKQNGHIAVANRIFEMLLYNYFLISADAQNLPIFKAASIHKSQFIRNGHLDMDMIMKKYVEHFDSIYGDQREEFDEDEGRRRFLLYIRPIINGTGNYYIEARTRNARRMDVVVDYLGERFIIELKIWRGNSYHERGKQQLSDYLDYFHLKKGYMLSYNFNQKKKIGVREIQLDGRILVEAVV